MKNLELIRSGGITKFVLVYGVLGLGVSTGILFSIIFTLVTQSSFERIFTFLPISIIAFSLGGVIWGGVMWDYFGSRHCRNISK
ncbi:MAG: hypothetical protein AAF558_09015 [Verrucomicrobiota bacterium]